MASTIKLVRGMNFSSEPLTKEKKKRKHRKRNKNESVMLCFETTQKSLWGEKIDIK